MKFLIFSDVHEDKKSIQELVKRAKKDDIDFIVCGGDFSTFGRGMRYVLKKFNEIGKKMYVIPGNHEETGDGLQVALADYEHCIDLHEKAIKVQDYVFLGYGGGGFSQEDATFRKISREWYGKYKDKKIVLVTHGPPINTKIDKLEQGHVGSIDYRKFIERIKPKLVISGHLHETVGMVDKIGQTKVVNPGWDGMVIELA